MWISLSLNENIQRFRNPVLFLKSQQVLKLFFSNSTHFPSNQEGGRITNEYQIDECAMCYPFLVRWMLRLRRWVVSDGNISTSQHYNSGIPFTVWKRNHFFPEVRFPLSSEPFHQINTPQRSHLFGNSTHSRSFLSNIFKIFLFCWALLPDSNIWFRISTRISDAPQPLPFHNLLSSQGIDLKWRKILKSFSCIFANENIFCWNSIFSHIFSNFSKNLLLSSVIPLRSNNTLITSICIGSVLYISDLQLMIHRESS